MHKVDERFYIEHHQIAIILFHCSEVQLLCERESFAFHWRMIHRKVLFYFFSTFWFVLNSTQNQWTTNNTVWKNKTLENSHQIGFSVWLNKKMLIYDAIKVLFVIFFQFICEFCKFSLEFLIHSHRFISYDLT